MKMQRLGKGPFCLKRWRFQGAVVCEVLSPMKHNGVNVFKRYHDFGIVIPTYETILIENYSECRIPAPEMHCLEVAC